MIVVEPRPSPSKSLAIAAPVLAGLAALVLAAIPIAFAGANPIDAYGYMVTGAFGSLFAFSETLTRTTPLILTGLAAAVAFRARLWNIGGEGQLYAGALAAVAVGTGAIDAPSWIMIPLVLIAGAIAGALFLLGPALLKLRFGADEVVTTLLLNFVMLLFVQMMLEGPLKDPMSLGWPQSAPIADAAALPALIPRMRVHAGLIVGLVAVAAVWLLMKRYGVGLSRSAPSARTRRPPAMPAFRSRRR